MSEMAYLLTELPHLKHRLACWPMLDFFDDLLRRHYI